MDDTILEPPAAEATVEAPVELPVEATPRPLDPRLDTRAWLAERIDGKLAGAVAIAWLVLLQVAFALEPATNQKEPIYGILLELTMYALLATMLTGLVMQRRFGLVASLGAAGFLTAMSIACPVSGHHPFGSWWYGQMACVLALVGASVYALHRSNRPHAESSPASPTVK
jgi:peptidoglycan/LPS O-acetylase OafA/YrhL